MTKEIYISSTPHETRLAVVEDDQLAEIYYERENEYTLAGSVYKGKVTRVLPGMQSAFVDIGLERDAFLYVTDFAEEQEDGDDYVALPEPQPHGRQTASPAANGHAAEAQPKNSDRQQGGNLPRREPSNVNSNAGPNTAASHGVPDTSGSKQAEEETSTGGRRWRGRRGRRRGRSSNTSQNSAAAKPMANAGEHSVDAGHEASASSTQAVPFEPDFEDFESTNFPVEQMESGHEEHSEVPPLQHQRAQDQAVEQPPQPSRSPRGTSPSPSTPMVLPGESLSKYRCEPASAVSERADAGHKSAPATATAPSPAPSFQPPTMVVGPLDWDGSGLLPGESISRYKSRPAVNARESFLSASPAAEAGPLAEESAPTSDLETAQAVPAPSDSMQSSLEHEQPFETVETHRDIAPTSAEAMPGLSDAPTAQDAFTEHGEVPQHVDPASPEIITESMPVSSPEAQQEPNEFDPAEASASYRFNPTTPSAYRQGSVAQPDAHAPVVSEGSSPSHSREESYPVTATQPVEESAFLAFTGYQKAQPEPTAEPFFSESLSIAPHGHSPAPEQPKATDGDTAWPQENVSTGGSAVEDSWSETEDSESSLEQEGDTHSLHAFNPGLGDLEEEMIDEEEAEAFAAHALAEETEYDDLIEETTDVQMDSGLLSELVRDQHIEQRTRFDEPETQIHDDEHAFDEEFLDQDAEPDGLGTEFPGMEFEGVPEDAFEEEADGANTDATPRPNTPRAPRRGTRGQQRQGGQGGDRRRMRRSTAQTSNLPAITELLKPNQEILVQIAKEPIARKGARITSHIALPGRFLVFMPTVNHVGVSRKISSDEERQRLKRILLSEKGTASGGFIVRTAAASASEEDLRADIRFLLTLWAEMRQRAESSKPPALIYHDLSLVERVLRDQVTDNFSAIWVDSEADYERVLRFLNRFEPKLVRRVKLYSKETPLFEQFGIQEEINKALRTKVWLKSGGSIVINQTEALVAIDINTGKYVGKTARLEDTIVKTNLDAIPEIVRQIRLRDLGGIIVIDFIDMDERKNRNKVMQSLEEALKADRAPSKVLQFNDFGLVAITRKRVKQSLERTLSVPCSTCVGTGMVKGPLTVCNEIYIELRKMHRQFDRGDVMLRVHPEVVKQLKTSNGRWLTEMEEMSGKTIIVKSDAALHPEQFDIH